MLSHTDVQLAIRGKEAQPVSSLVGGQGEPRHHRMSHPWQDDVFLVEVKLAAEFCRNTLCHQHIENGWFYLQHSSLHWGFQGLSRDTWGTDDWEMYKYVTSTAGNLCLQLLRSFFDIHRCPFQQINTANWKLIFLVILSGFCPFTFQACYWSRGFKNKSQLFCFYPWIAETSQFWP